MSNISPSNYIKSSILPISSNAMDRDMCHETAKKLTAVFFTQLVDNMFKTHNDHLGGFGEEMCESLLYGKIADHLINTSTGQEMTSLIEHQMISLQEKNYLKESLTELHDFEKENIGNDKLRKSYEKI